MSQSQSSRSFSAVAHSPLQDEIIHRVYRPFVNILKAGERILSSNYIITEEELTEFVESLKNSPVIHLPIVTFIGGTGPGQDPTSSDGHNLPPVVPGEFIVGYSMLSYQDLAFQKKERAYVIARERAINLDKTLMKMRRVKSSDGSISLEPRTPLAEREYIRNIAPALNFFIVRCFRKWPDLQAPKWIRDLMDAKIIDHIDAESAKKRLDGSAPSYMNVVEYPASAIGREHVPNLAKTAIPGGTIPE